MCRSHLNNVELFIVESRNNFYIASLKRLPVHDFLLIVCAIITITSFKHFVGDAALFGVNGFNMLLDGGFSRKACFWDFVRHLDRLDAVLMTRLNNSNIGGISSILRRKRKDAVYPHLGHFFCNIQVNYTVLAMTQLRKLTDT